MDIPDRPPLDPYVLEELEVELHSIDKHWWTELSELSVTTAIPGLTYLPSGPLPPKQPLKLKNYLQRYAVMLFDAERRLYPNEFLRHWLLKLAERVEARVMGLISRIEGTINFSGFGSRKLSYHGVSDAEMRQTIRETLNAIIERSAPSDPLQLPDRVGEDEKLKAEIFEAAEVEKPIVKTGPNAEVERRAKLLAEYKIATGEPSDYQIYNAENSGIHKAEFYDWKKGKLLSQSKTTKNLENFLREKKPPIPRKP